MLEALAVTFDNATVAFAVGELTFAVVWLGGLSENWPFAGVNFTFAGVRKMLLLGESILDISNPNGCYSTGLDCCL